MYPSRHNAVHLLSSSRNYCNHAYRYYARKLIHASQKIWHLFHGSGWNSSLCSCLWWGGWLDLIRDNHGEWHFHVMLASLFLHIDSRVAVLIYLWAFCGMLVCCQSWTDFWRLWRASGFIMGEKLVVPRRRVRKNWYEGLSPDPTDRTQNDVHDDSLIVSSLNATDHNGTPPVIGNFYFHLP